MRAGERIQRVELDGRVRVTLGRGPDNDVAIPDRLVSRNHARLMLEDGGWVYEDLGSRFGSRFDGQNDRRRRLEQGDEARISPATIVRFEAAESDTVADGDSTVRSGGGSAALSRTFAGLGDGSGWSHLRSAFTQTPEAPSGGDLRLEALFQITQSVEQATDFNTVLVR
jgi:pSer/pThr/pTyr-binding forkhead associated (FHA) protein